MHVKKAFIYIDCIKGRCSFYGLSWVKITYMHVKKAFIYIDFTKVRCSFYGFGWVKNTYIYVKKAFIDIGNTKIRCSLYGLGWVKNTYIYVKKFLFILTILGLNGDTIAPEMLISRLDTFTKEQIRCNTNEFIRPIFDILNTYRILVSWTM